MGRKPKDKENKQDEEDYNKITNFYELEECKKFSTEYINPNYNEFDFPIKHPQMSIIVGATGSGKSNVLLDMIKKMSGTYEYIKIFTQDKSEQLYEFLESKIEKPYLEIMEGIKAFNDYDLTKLEKAQYLFIFDDFVIEKQSKQQKICELYVRGRKMAQKCGISCIYLSQSYYQIPIVIRKQAFYLILKKINGKRDLKAILNDCSIKEIEGQQLLNMYDYCVSSADDISNFMLIDKKGKTDYAFRKNYSEILNPDDFI